ncbi:MAG: sulfonate ABC transporter ATP-binding protein [Planctomyces sp.]|nr:sulfonate ABC transporter ATP-binding protein [Planctomyces sp.]
MLDVAARPFQSGTSPAPVVTTQGTLTVSHCDKSFLIGDQLTPILRDVSLTVEAGQFLCVVGGSGCGKSTLLRVIAGLETAERGSVALGDQVVTKPGLDRGVVFQEHRLLPWLNVWQNIDFGLSQSVRSGRDRIIADHIRLVGLEGFEMLHPGQLSGGMAQRAGLARALVNHPRVLLLDEPFGALDALTRWQMQTELLRIWEAERATMILVTHDIDEAIYLADQIIVLGGRPGNVRQRFQVELPRPRDRGASGFAELRREIWDAIFLKDDGDTSSFERERLLAELVAESHAT